MAQIGYKADRKRILYDSSYLIDLYIKKGFSRDQAIRLAEEESANKNAFKNPISPLRESSEWITNVANILRDQKNTEDYKKLLKEDYSITYEQLENLDPVRSLYKGTDIEINKLENIILKVMRFKKGSKAAKDFMAKLRAAKNKAVKKATVVKAKAHKITDKAKKVKAALMSGSKHTDIKSHNYKISINGSFENQKNDILKSIKMELARLSMLKLRIDTCKRAIKNNTKDKKEVLRLKNVIKEAKIFIDVHKQNIKIFKKLIK